MKLQGRLRKAVASAAVFAVVIGTVNNAVAADEMIGFGKETFQLNLGFYRPTFSTTVAESKPGSPIPPGTINGEDDLGLDSTLSVARLDGYWRFADRHRLYFGYYQLDRDASRVLTKDIGPIEIPDLGVNETIKAGSNINTTAKMQVYILGYGYSFYKSETMEFAGKVGLNVAKLGTKINGTLITQSNGTLTASTAGSEVTAPLPAFGFTGDWALSERWRMKGNVGGFKIEVNDVTATVVDAGVAAEYRLFRNFGVGAGYSLLRAKAEVNKPDSAASLDWRTGGFQIYGSLLF